MLLILVIVITVLIFYLLDHHNISFFGYKKGSSGANLTDSPIPTSIPDSYELS